MNGIKKEFAKIKWPTGVKVRKQSFAVIAGIIVTAAIAVGIDTLCMYLLKLAA